MRNYNEVVEVHRGISVALSESRGAVTCHTSMYALPSWCAYLSHGTMRFREGKVTCHTSMYALPSWCAYLSHGTMRLREGKVTCHTSMYALPRGLRLLVKRLYMRMKVTQTCARVTKSTMTTSQ